MRSAWVALFLGGRQVVLHGAVPCCLQGQVVRRRLVATEEQPVGPSATADIAGCQFLPQLGAPRAERVNGS
jgi:hypothetical protein